MTEVSRNLRNIFFHEIPPILKLEVGFLSEKKSFSQIFENTPIFFSPKFQGICGTFLIREVATHDQSFRLKRIPFILIRPYEKNVFLFFCVFFIFIFVFLHEKKRPATYGDFEPKFPKSQN